VPALRLCAARETLFGRTPIVEFEAVCLGSLVLLGGCVPRELCATRLCAVRETLSGRMPERQLNREDERESRFERLYAVQRTLWLCAADRTKTMRRLCACFEAVCYEGFVPALRLCAARETLWAERLRAAKLRVDLRIVEYTQKQKQTANRRGRRPEREATAARRRYESKLKGTKASTEEAQKRQRKKRENKTQEARKREHKSTLKTTKTRRKRHENKTQEARKQAREKHGSKHTRGTKASTDRQKYKHRRVGAVGEVTCGARFCPPGGFPSSFTQMGIQAYRHTGIQAYYGTKA
jgi:hypothetical protein